MKLTVLLTYPFGSLPLYRRAAYRFDNNLKKKLWGQTCIVKDNKGLTHLFIVLRDFTGKNPLHKERMNW